MSRRLEKLIKFVRFCDELAQLSTCKRNKCGAIVFDWAFTQVKAIGYNGPSTQLDNDSCTGVPGECGCVHAEANALLKVDPTLRRSYAMYATTFPCVHCAGLIANSGMINVLFYRDAYRNDRGYASLNAAGIIIASVHDQKVLDDVLENA